MDSSYRVHNNVSVRRDIIWDISIQGIHKGVVLFSLVCALEKAIKIYEVKVDEQKGALRFREIWQ